MSNASEESAITVASQAAADAGTADHQDATVDAGKMQDSEAAAAEPAAAEPGIANDQQLCDVAEAVSEPEFTNVSSEASSSFQGLSDCDSG